MVPQQPAARGRRVSRAPAYTDGTCKWLWIGSVRGAATFDTTTVIYEQAAAVTSRYAHPRTITLDAATYALGSLPVKIVGGIAGTWRNGLAAKDTNGATVAAPDFNSPAECAGIVFGTDADQISLGTLYPTWGYGRDNFSTAIIVVNGRQLCESMYGPNGVFEYMTLDLTKVAEAGTDKIVEIYCRSGFTNIKVDAAARVWDPSSPGDLTIAFEGDSSTRGGNSGGAQPGVWPGRLGRKLGFANTINYAVGGTRITNSGAKTSFLERLDYLLQTNADIYYISTHNDVDNPGAGVSQANRIPAITTYLTECLRRAPNKLFIFAGCIPLQSELTTASQPGGLFYQCETDIKNIIAQINSPNLIYVPFVLDPRGMPTFGSGASDSLQFDGNADWCFGPDKDGNQDGHGNLRHTRILGSGNAVKVRSALASSIVV